MATPDKFTLEGLEALKRAVNKALERKRLLGHYAAFWRDGQVVLEGPDAPKVQPNPKRSNVNQEYPPQELDAQPRATER